MNPKAPLKILLFSSKGAGDHYFGPGMSAYRMYSGLTGKEAEVHLAHGYQSQPRLPLFKSYHYISDLQGNLLVKGLPFYINLKKWVSNNVDRFDVVHCLGAFHPSFLVANEFSKRGVPAFIKITEARYTGFTQNSMVSKMFGLQSYRKKNADNIAGFISISSEIRNKLEEAGINPEKIYSIPNGVDIERFCPVSIEQKKKFRDELGVNDRFTVLFTGAFSDRKNPYLVVKAFKAFYNHSDIQLMLAGPDADGGVQRRLIEKTISEKQIENIFAFQNRNDVGKLYKASDLFVLPSNEEGLSNAMLEALACGLPVCTTKISGSEDVIIELKNGIFIDRDENNIINAIKRYFNNSSLLQENSVYARNTIVEKYTADQTLNKHMDLFKRVIAGRTTH